MSLQPPSNFVSTLLLRVHAIDGIADTVSMPSIAEIRAGVALRGKREQLARYKRLAAFRAKNEGLIL